MTITHMGVNDLCTVNFIGFSVTSQLILKKIKQILKTWNSNNYIQKFFLRLKIQKTNIHAKISRYVASL